MLPMLVPMLSSVIGGLCADAATNLAKEHVMKIVERVIPPQAMDAIDTLVNADPSNPCETMEDLIDCMVDPDNDDVPSLPGMPAIEDVTEMAGGMMQTVAGMVGPIEMQVKLSFDPASMDVNIEKV